MIYKDMKALADVTNRSFNEVFTREKEFVRPRGVQDQGRMEDLQVTIQEINNILNSLDGKKATGPDGVSGWILKECRDELKDKLHSIICTSMNHGTVPQDWKRADIVPCSREEMLKIHQIIDRCHWRAWLLKFVKR